MNGSSRWAIALVKGYSEEAPLWLTFVPKRWFAVLSVIAAKHGGGNSSAHLLSINALWKQE